MAKHLLSVGDLDEEEIKELVKECALLKGEPERYADSLKDKSLVMLFEKPSTRTRISFEAGLTRMGGHAIYFDPSMSQLSRGESISDTADAISSIHHPEPPTRPRWGTGLRQRLSVRRIISPRSIVSMNRGSV